MTTKPLDETRIDREKKRWDEEASTYVDYHDGNWGHIYDEIASRLRSELTDQSRVVELGCGTGLVTLRIAKHAGQIVGYDISDKMLEYARQKAVAEGVDNVEFENGDAYHIPEEDDTFDIALCCFLLDIIQDPTAALKEAKRLLKPGGTLITVTDCYQDTRVISPTRILARKFKHFITSLFPSRAIDHIPSDTILEELTRNAGFRIVETAILDLDLESQGLFNLYIKAKQLH